MEARHVYKIATADGRVREFLERNGWESQGEDEETQMDSYRSKSTGRRLCIEDITDDFPVTFLIGELPLDEFGAMVHALTPGLKLLEVDSSWEGRSTSVTVAMSVAQVRKMFGRSANMRRL